MRTFQASWSTAREIEVFMSTRYLDRNGKLTTSGRAAAVSFYNPAVGAMIEWFRAGKAATKAQYGSPSPYVIERALTDHELRTDIALETYVSSLRPFFEHVDNGGFDPSAGASLTT
ncbi:hypothetical protein, partial [Tsukamurella pseudospumae]